MFESTVQFILNTVSSISYFGIFLLMLLESTFFPFPSEVVMIPAGYLSFQGKMNVFLAVIIGVLGSIVGAWVNYIIASKLGRPVILKLGKYFFVTEKKLQKMERLFEKHGEIITFIGRLLPGIRQLISFPAGLTKMNKIKFTIYTAIGASIWVTILSALGFFIGQNQVLIHKYVSQITYSLIVFCVIIGSIYIINWYNK